MKREYISIKNSLLSLLLLTSVTMIGCKEKIDIKLKETYVRLVVDGELTDEQKRHTIKITQTSNYFANDAQPKVTGAIVTLSDGSSTIYLTETQPGIYQTDSTFAGVIGRTYTLNIKYEEEEFVATSQLKAVANLDSISFTLYNDHFSNSNYTVNMWAQEPPTVGDYYLWLYYRNGVLMSDTLKEIMFTSDEMVNGNYVSNFPVYPAELNLGDTVTLEMKSINKDYYNFIYAVFSEAFMAGTPFSGPPSNVKGNIKNITNKDKVAMGYFITSAVSKKTRILQ